MRFITLLFILHVGTLSGQSKFEYGIIGLGGVSISDGFNPDLSTEMLTIPKNDKPIWVGGGPGLEYNVSRNVLAGKMTAWIGHSFIPFYFIYAGGSYVYYRQGTHHAQVLRPEIGIQFFLFRVRYGRNLPVDSRDFTEYGNNWFSIELAFPIKGP